MCFGAGWKIETVALANGVADRLVQVAGNHFADQFSKRDFGVPVQLLPGFVWIAEKAFDFGGSEVIGIDSDENLPWFKLG